MRYRTKVFLSAFLIAAASLVVAAVLIPWSLRSRQLEATQRNLAAEAQLVARSLAEQPSRDVAALDAEANVFGRIVTGRVTFIAADGRVLGDSAVDGEDLLRLESHATRPEVRAAMQTGLGSSLRHSATTDRDMLYVAVPVARGPVSVVRLALPLTSLRQQAAETTKFVVIALGVALLGAVGLAWVSSRVLARRLDTLAAAAREYAAGNLARRVRDLRQDELGDVARVLDESVQMLGQRVLDLARDRARMEAILGGMVEGVLVVSERGEVELVNEAARNMLRLVPDATGRRYLELIRHPDLVGQLGQALRGEMPQAIELSLDVEQGRALVARAAPVASPGERGAVLVLHDITDLRRADRMRRDFVANVSHELRTPLTAIRGYVEALLDEPGDDDTRQHFLAIIERHAWRMERLVKDLLRLARLDAGQEVLERARCQVDGVFSGVLAELAPALEARGQRVEVRIAPAAAEVTGDPAKLHDVLKNLVENASNYAPERSVITLESFAETGRVCLRVADQGPGIPEVDLQRIFERFYRVDKARSRETGGTGLGLSIVRHLVGLHGGDVQAANRPEGGAVFTVRLPL